MIVIVDKPIPTHITVTVIVVNYNSGRWLHDSLFALSLQEHKPTSVTVIDNNSTDQSLVGLREMFPDFDFVLLDKNIGFAAANNLAIAKCNTPLVALLNPDAFPEPGWLGALVRAANDYPESGSFGSMLLMNEKPDFLDGIEDIYHASGLSWRGGHGRKFIAADLVAREIFSPCAAAALYRTDAVRDVGYFDEDYFCYFEDMDLGIRLRLAGWTSRFVPEAKVLHVGGATNGGRHSKFSTYHGHRNLTWTFFKNMPGFLLWLLIPWHISMTVLSFIYLSYKGQMSVFVRSKADAIMGLPSALRKRKKVQSKRKISASDFSMMLNMKIIPDRLRDSFGTKR